MNLPAWIALQILCADAGISTSFTPKDFRASTTPLSIVPRAGVVPASPAERIPRGFIGVRTSWHSVVKKEKDKVGKSVGIVHTPKIREKTNKKKIYSPLPLTFFIPPYTVNHCIYGLNNVTSPV